jgi:hypothetical protein
MFTATGIAPPLKLVGTRVELNGVALPLVHASPGRVDAVLPADLTPDTAVDLRVWVIGRASQPIPVQIVESAPVVIGAERQPDRLMLLATGLGVAPEAISATVNGTSAEVLAYTASKTRAAVHEIQLRIPEGITGSLEVQMEVKGKSSNRFTIEESPRD